MKVFDEAETPKIEAPEEIKKLASERWEAKKAKNYALADELRKKAIDAGWIILDKKDGFEINKA